MCGIAPTLSIIGTTITCSFASPACSARRSPQAVARSPPIPRRPSGGYRQSITAASTCSADSTQGITMPSAPMSSPFRQRRIPLGETDQHHGIAPQPGPHVFVDFFPVEMAVLGINHHPVEPRGDSQLRHGCRFQGHPQAVARRIGCKSSTKSLESGGLQSSRLPERAGTGCVRHQLASMDAVVFMIGPKTIGARPSVATFPRAAAIPDAIPEFCMPTSKAIVRQFRSSSRIARHAR